MAHQVLCVTEREWHLLWVAEGGSPFVGVAVKRSLPLLEEVEEVPVAVYEMWKARHLPSGGGVGQASSLLMHS